MEGWRGWEGLREVARERASLAFRYGGLLGHRVGQFREHRLEFFARLELNDGAGRDDDIFFGLIRVPSDAGFPHLDFEDAEVTEFDGLALRHALGEAVEQLLNDLHYVLLDLPRFVADANH